MNIIVKDIDRNGRPIENLATVTIAVKQYPAISQVAREIGKEEEKVSA